MNKMLGQTFIGYHDGTFLEVAKILEKLANGDSVQLTGFGGDEGPSEVDDQASMLRHIANIMKGE